MPPTTQFVRNVRMKGTPMSQVMAAARQGGFSYLAELLHRTCDFYTPAVVDVFLGHLREPNPGTQPDVNQRFRAYLPLLALLQVAEACKRRPSQRLLAANKLGPALDGIVDWIYLVLCLKRDEWCEGYPYSFSDVAKYEDLVLVLLEMAGIDETVKKAIATNPLIIDLAVMSWVAAPNGHPLLYASGNHLSAEYCDGPEEPTITLFHLIAETNPWGLGTAILNGGICSPQRFFVRASQRMWALVKPNILPHLHHVSDIPTEDLNFTRVVRIVKALVDALPDLAAPMLETMLPVYFMDALARASGRARAIECRPGRMDYMENLLELAVDVAHWAELRSLNFVPTAKHVISGGLVQILGACTTLAEDQPDSARPFRTLIQLLVNWSTSPRLFRSASSEMSKHLFQQLEELDEVSDNAGAILRALHTNNILWRSWRKPARLRPCDNVTHRLNAEGAKAKDGGACSGCRSVVYRSAYCQSQDWDAFHRYECRAMRSEYFRGAGCPNARLSQNARTFRTTVIRSVYASNFARWHDAMQVMLVNLIVDEPVWFVPVSRYVEILRKMIPGHLEKRFERLIEMFTESNFEDSGTAMPGSFDVLGSEPMGLVHATFHYAQDAEYGIIVLFRRAQGSGSGEFPYDPASGFEMEASLVYHIQDPFRLKEALNLIPPAVGNGVQTVRPTKDRCAIYDCRVSEERQIHCHCEECHADPVHENEDENGWCEEHSQVDVVDAADVAD